MYDIRSHIIYRPDDASINNEDSIRMCRNAARSGVKGIVATPRYDGGIDDYTPAAILQKVRLLNRRLGDAGLDIQVFPGMEVDALPNLVELYDDKRILALNCKRYILVRLHPDRDIPTYTGTMLFNLEIRGLRPVIAHPERCRAIISNPGIMLDLIDRDCIVQADAGSIMGLYGRDVQRMAHIFLKSNMVHVISAGSCTDSLDTCLYRDCCRSICRKYGEELGHNLFVSNPLKIINGQDIYIPEPLPEKRTMFRRQ